MQREGFRLEPGARVMAPAVAGMFYPGDARALRGAVDDLLGRARPQGRAPKAVIAPHAGYRYSGAVAADAYARLAERAGEVERVVLVGPSHHVPFHGLAVPGVDALATPLGAIPIDARGVAAALDDPAVQVLDAAFEREHSLEVHLPFLQATLGAFRIVPLVAGAAEPETVARVLERLWGGAETAFVVSTDLSHFLDYESARQIDARTDASIRALRLEDIDPRQACGRVGLAGLLLLARRRRLAVETLDLRNSGDTAGDKRRVVGYGSWAVLEDEPRIGADARRAAIALAREALLAAARGDPEPTLDLEALPEVLRTRGACFVTLREAGRLRGCIGTLAPARPLAADIVHNARAAALGDPRFAPLDADSVDGVEVSISVLGPLEALRFDSEDALLARLRPGLDGLCLRDGEHRGTFLPTVWESIPDPAGFLRALKRKAGLPEEHWSDTLRVERYVTESFGQ